MKVEFHKEDKRGNVIRTLTSLKVGKIVVPKGFESDGASVPRCFWRVIFPPTDSKAVRGGVVHDYLYRTPCNVTRVNADKLFRRLLIEDGVKPWRANLAYIGVRLFGKSSWRCKDGIEH